MLAIYKREMRAYFTSPVGYMFCAIFFAVSAFLYMTYTIRAGQNSSFPSYFALLLFVFVVIIPLLTMKSISEERKMRTDQLIMTAPVTLFGVVFGKYLAAFTMFGGSFLLSSLVYYIPLSQYGSPNLAVYFGCVIGVLFVGCAFIAMGIFVSSLTENQFIAAFGTMGVIGLFLLVDALNSNINVVFLRTVFSSLSVTSRYGYFAAGVLRYDSIFYFLSLSGVFLFLTVRVLEKRRWSKS